MLDIHAHLFWDSYDADRDEVIRRARAAGVDKMICVGTSPQDNPQATFVAEHYPNIWAAVGIHPHYFNELGIENQELREKASIHNSQFAILSEEKEQIKELMEDLRAIAKYPKVIAIGECGLDYYSRDKQSAVTSQQKAIQRAGFVAQIALAQELDLPLIIHTRPSAGSQDAYEDLHAILSGLDAKPSTLNAVLHCYQGDTEITKKFLALPNVYFSFAGTITYPVKLSIAGTKNDPTETVKLIPLERMFVETDCPFLSPQEKRGERNEPAYVRMTAEKVCALKGMEAAALETALDGNFQRVFVPQKV